MSWDFILSAMVTTFITAFTPGPNNTICTAIGVSHGFRRALPYAFGVTVGFPLLLVVIGTGLGGFINAYPDVQIVLKICGGAFLIYLSYQIATAKPQNINHDDTTTAATPQDTNSDDTTTAATPQDTNSDDTVTAKSTLQDVSSDDTVTAKSAPQDVSNDDTATPGKSAAQTTTGKSATVTPGKFAPGKFAADSTGKSVPGFFQAVLFQWINPKAVSFSFSLVSVFLRPQSIAADLTVLVIITAVMSLGSTVSWAFAGTVIRHALKTPHRQRAFNRTLGTLLFITALYILFL